MKQNAWKQMTWLDLYGFLFERANNINAVGTFDWNKPVLVYDADTGDKFNCDTYYADDDELVLISNMEKIINESSN